jgi:hypothetical protein
MTATALTPIRPALGLVTGGEYQPFTIYPEQPGAIFNAGDFLQVFTTGTITTPTPAGSLLSFQPTSAPTVVQAGSASSGNPQHTLFAWYTLIGTGGVGVIESQPYEIGPIINASGFNATVLVPADGNYPAAATHFALYVGTLPGQQWLQVATTALGSAATIPAYPLTNNTGVNRCINDPGSGIVGYAAYDAGSGYAQREGDILAAGYNWRALFGVDQSLSGNQALLEQYMASVVKLQNVPVTISLLQPWAGQTGTAGIVYSTTYGVFYLDTTQSNGIFSIQRPYGGLYGPYNPNGVQVGNTYQPVTGIFIGGLA